MRRVLCFATAVLSCGVVSPGSDGGGDASGRDASDAGWTACSSPGGQRICGSADCQDDPKTCSCWSTRGSVGMCILSPGVQLGNCARARDGDVCVFPRGVCDPGGGECAALAPFEMGVLFQQRGAGDRVRYADLGLFDGTPLPLPASCPTLKSARICGGYCGGCGDGETCRGRSPLHPYGFCQPALNECSRTNTKNCAPGVEGCFLFRVQPAVQSDADNDGACIPIAACKELASPAYPGGGDCVAP